MTTKKIVRLLQQLDIETRAKRFLETQFWCQKRHVLGLDLNTKSTGFTLLNERAQLVRFGAVSTRHVPNGDICQVATVLTRELATQLQLQELESESERVEWTVGIEDFMRTFHGGQFHTSGLLQLVQLNGMVSFWCWQHVLKEQKPLLHFHPTNARAFFELHQQPQELPLGDHATSHLCVVPVDPQPNACNAKQTTKTNKNKKNSKVVKDVVLRFVQSRHPLEDAWTHHARDTCYDIADSYVIALMAWQTHFQSSWMVHEHLLRLEFEELYVRHNQSRMNKRRDTMSAHEFAQWMDRKFVHALNEWMKLHYNQLVRRDDR